MSDVKMALARDVNQARRRAWRAQLVAMGFSFSLFALSMANMMLRLGIPQPFWWAIVVPIAAVWWHAGRLQSRLERVEQELFDACNADLDARLNAAVERLSS